MKDLFMTLALGIAISLAPIVCVVAAAYLAIHDKGGWGWFLLVALFCGSKMKFRKDKPKNSPNNKTEPPHEQ